MCRHFCYLGETVALSELMLRPPHSLLVQSYAPKDMCGGGRINADGFGVGWYSGTPGAARYRRAGPIWQDGGFTELAEHTSASAVLGAVRNATAGMAVSDGASAPFTDGSWLFSLNGRIDGWPDSAVALAEELPTRQLLRLDAPTDAALLWAVLCRRLTAGGAGTPDPAEVLAGLVADVLAAAPSSRLNLMLTNGTNGYATTVTHSLWVRSLATSTVLASEPFDDDPAWQRVEDGRLVVADRTGVALHKLPGW
jgi:glutamine amidotransferase